MRARHLTDRMFRPLLLLLLAASLCACATVSHYPELTGAPPAGTSYRLGTGDDLRVIVFDEASLSGQFVVDGTGKVSLPLVGEVQAGGLTVTEFQQGVQAALADGFLVNPRVAVQVVGYRPFYILGEVNKPGEYPYTVGLTVLNAVATAEGFSYRANEKVVLIKHAGESEEKAWRLTVATPVQPGDTIRIKERYF